MGKGEEGWETVKAPKAAQYMKKKQEEARQQRDELSMLHEQGKAGAGDVVGANYAADGKPAKKGKVDKFKQAADELLPQFDALEAAATNPALKFAPGAGKTKKQAEDPPSPEKKGMTEEEKAAAKKERKKEKAKELKAEAKKEAATKVIIGTKLAEHVPKDLVAALRKLPVTYRGKVKDQLRIACEQLDYYFVPEAIMCENYKQLTLEERFSLPLSAQSDGSLAAALAPIFDAADDKMMLGAVLRDCVAQAFGRLNGCSRPDDGRHYLGTKIFIQMMLRARPDAFSCDVRSLEDLFQNEPGGKQMTGNAAMNYAWVLAQVPSRGAAPAIRAWARVFLPRLLEQDGGAKGAVVDAGYAAAAAVTKAGGQEYPGWVEDRRRWRAENGDPLTLEHLLATAKLAAPKRARVTKLLQGTIAPFSILFTGQSPVKYFVRLAQLLLPHPDAKFPILGVLGDAMILDPNAHGCLHHWSDSYLLVVRETALILQYMSQNQKELSHKLNGPEIEKLFDRLKQKSEAVLRGELVPEGKKQSKAVVEQKDVEKVLENLRKASGLTKARPASPRRASPRGASRGAAAAAQAPKKKAGKPASGGGRGCCSTLLFVAVLVGTIIACLFVALPFLPPDMQRELRKAGNGAAAFARPHVQQLAEWPPLKPHIETVSGLFR